MGNDKHARAVLCMLYAKSTPALIGRGTGLASDRHSDQAGDVCV